MAQAKKICVVGSGSWGSVVAKIIGNNVQGKSSYVDRVSLYVHDEIVDGKKLSEIINLKHENTKYLPGYKLPENVVAIPDIVKACSDCDILVFVTPHQFLAKTCEQLVGHVKPHAVGVSLVKGVDVHDGKLDLISNIIRNTLKIECAVLMGANIAPDVAQEQFCEATIGCRNKEMGKALKELFQTPYFRVVVMPDEETVELCGALKNIVALGAGFVDGLKYGDNTKAAVIRLGLMEMIEFCKRFHAGVKVDTFLQSCGVADLVTSCYSGRNRKVAEAFAGCKNSNKTFEELEKHMLDGQKLQGPPTAADVFQYLEQKARDDGFPMFVAVHRICVGELPAESFLLSVTNHPEHG